MELSPEHIRLLRRTSSQLACSIAGWPSTPPESSFHDSLADEVYDQLHDIFSGRTLEEFVA